MGRASRFTEAEIKRAIKAARSEDPRSIVEISRGSIRILPPDDTKLDSGRRNEVDAWFANDD